MVQIDYQLYDKPTLRGTACAMDARSDIAGFAALDLNAYAQRLAAKVLDCLCVPFVLIDGNGRIACSNKLSEAILAQGLHIRRKDDRLVLQSPNQDEEMRRYLKALGRGTVGISFVVDVSDQSPPLFVSLNAFIPPAVAGYPEMRPLAAVLIREGEEKEGLAVARQRFSLSEAETAVLTAMSAGISIAQHASNRGVSIHTARKQLANLMAKVGVSRQNELVMVIDRLSGRGRDRAAPDAMIMRKKTGRLTVSP